MEHHIINSAYSLKHFGQNREKWNSKFLRIVADGLSFHACHLSKSVSTIKHVLEMLPKLILLDFKHFESLWGRFFFNNLFLFLVCLYKIRNPDNITYENVALDEIYPMQKNSG